MKIGDLVQLSSYGLARGYNNRITMVDPNQVGLVVSVKSPYNRSYPYVIRWTKTSWEYSPFQPSHSRRELKYARR